MAWIESHQSLATHRKLLAFRRSLNVRVTCAIGILHLLWWWCLDNAGDGDLSMVDDDDLREVCHWDGDGKTLVDALVSSGFLDSNRHIHNWKRYAGKLLDARDKARKRMRTLRARLPNVTRTFASTVPNPTVPNPTVQNQGEGDALPKSVTVEIPSWEEFWSYMQVRHPIPEWYAKDKFLAAKQSNWRGKENWKAYAARVEEWWRRDGCPQSPDSRRSGGNGTPAGLLMAITAKLKALEEMRKDARDLAYDDEGKAKLKRIEDQIKAEKAKIGALPT